MIKKFEGEHEFLSNLFISTFIHNGIKYKSVAHAFYSLKCKNLNDRIRIRETKDVKEAIRESKKVPIVDTWQVECRNVMKELIRQKFENPFLMPRLLETNEQWLGDGKNFVGEILMEIRDEFRNKSTQDT